MGDKSHSNEKVPRDRLYTEQTQNVANLAVNDKNFHQSASQGKLGNSH